MEDDATGGDGVTFSTGAVGIDGGEETRAGAAGGFKKFGSAFEPVVFVAVVVVDGLSSIRSGPSRLRPLRDGECEAGMDPDEARVDVRWYIEWLMGLFGRGMPIDGGKEDVTGGMGADEFNEGAGAGMGATTSAISAGLCGRVGS